MTHLGLSHLYAYTNLSSHGENVSKAFINRSRDKSCPGENLVCMATIRINLSLLTICCAQSQCRTEVFPYTNQFRAHTGTELCPPHHTSAHAPRGACSAGHSSLLQLTGTKTMVCIQAQGPGGFPAPHSLVPIYIKTHQGQIWNLDLGWSRTHPSGPDTFLLCPPR